MFLTLSEDFKMKQQQKINRAKYMPRDRVLLALVKTYRFVTYTVGTWKAWAALRRHLFLSHIGKNLPTHWIIEDILNAMPLLHTWQKSC